MEKTRSHVAVFYRMISLAVDIYQVHLQYCTILQSNIWTPAMNWIAISLHIGSLQWQLLESWNICLVTVSWANFLSFVLYHHFDAWIVGLDFNSQHHSHASFYVVTHTHTHTHTYKRFTAFTDGGKTVGQIN